MTDDDRPLDIGQTLDQRTRSGDNMAKASARRTPQRDLLGELLDELTERRARVKEEEARRYPVLDMTDEAEQTDIEARHEETP